MYASLNIYIYIYNGLNGKLIHNWIIPLKNVNKYEILTFLLCFSNYECNHLLGCFVSDRLSSTSLLLKQ